MILKKRFNKLKAVDPQTDENKVLKPKVLDNVGDLFNELYYIYKDKYNDDKKDLNTKNKNFSYYKILRLTDDYQYEYEEEKEKQQTSKKLDKKELPEKSMKGNASNFNEWVIEKKQAKTVKYFRNILSFKDQVIC